MQTLSPPTITRTPNTLSSSYQMAGIVESIFYKAPLHGKDRQSRKYVKYTICITAKRNTCHHHILISFEFCAQRENKLT